MLSIRKMLQEEIEAEDNGSSEEEVHTTTVKEEYEDDVDYTERFTLKMEAGWNPGKESIWRSEQDWDRSVTMKFEAEYLGEVLDQFKTFLKASGFTYITQLKACSASGEEWESEEDI